MKRTSLVLACLATIVLVSAPSNATADGTPGERPDRVLAVRSRRGRQLHVHHQGGRQRPTALPRLHGGFAELVARRPVRRGHLRSRPGVFPDDLQRQHRDHRSIRRQLARAGAGRLAPGGHVLLPLVTGRLAVRVRGRERQRHERERDLHDPVERRRRAASHHRRRGHGRRADRLVARRFADRVRSVGLRRVQQAIRDLRRERGRHARAAHHALGLLRQPRGLVGRRQVDRLRPTGTVDLHGASGRDRPQDTAARHRDAGARLRRRRLVVPRRARSS